MYVYLILHPKVHAKTIAPRFGGNNDLHTFDVLHHAVMFYAFVNGTCLGWLVSLLSPTMLSICLVLCNPIVLWVTLYRVEPGSSSLMCALYCGHVEVAKMLFIGARVNVTLIALYSSAGYFIAQRISVRF